MCNFNVYLQCNRWLRQTVSLPRGGWWPEQQLCYMESTHIFISDYSDIPSYCYKARLSDPSNPQQINQSTTRRTRVCISIIGCYSTNALDHLTHSHLHFRATMLQHMPPQLLRSRESLFPPPRGELARCVRTAVAAGVGHGVAMLLPQVAVQVFLVLEAGALAALDGALEGAGV